MFGGEECYVKMKIPSRLVDVLLTNLEVVLIYVEITTIAMLSGQMSLLAGNSLRGFWDFQSLWR